MMLGRCLKLAWMTLAVVAQAHAQRLPSVVQLPSFRTFSYSGSVLVPDGGSAYLGGNMSSSSSFNRRGLSRGLGLSHAASQASVHATIIDLNEMDRQLLGGTPGEFMNASRPQRPRAADPVEEGKQLVRLARQQFRDGKQTASMDTYLMAINVLSGRLRELAEVEFRRQFGTAAEQSLRMASLRR